MHLCRWFFLRGVYQSSSGPTRLHHVAYNGVKWTIKQREQLKWMRFYKRGTVTRYISQGYLRDLLINPRNWWRQEHCSAKRKKSICCKNCILARQSTIHFFQIWMIIWCVNVTNQSRDKLGSSHPYDLCEQNGVHSHLHLVSFKLIIHCIRGEIKQRW